MIRILLLLALALGPAMAHAGAVTPVRAIRAQTILAADDLTEMAEDVPGAVAAIDAAVGLEAKTTLYPGRPVLVTQIGPPALVERNQPVRMTFAEGPLLITTEGRALDRGGFGESGGFCEVAPSADTSADGASRPH
jgi:flagella basal body P-ring formation protein FlgA